MLVMDNKMETKFKVGDKVFSPGDRFYIGEVVDVEVNGQPPYPSKNNILFHVKWDNDNTYTYEEEELRLVDPEAEQALRANLALRIKAMTSRFEQAFNMWQEIQDLANDFGDAISSFEDDPELGPLMKNFESIVEKGGWSSSSIYC